MWFWLSATARPHATTSTIAAKRHQWVAFGKDQQLHARCRSARRFVVEGDAPARVFWLLETDDVDAPGLIVEHFGDLWDIEVHRVNPQAVVQASSG